MEKIPITWAGRAVGQLTAEQQGLYTRLTADCQLPEEGLWCVWAQGDGDELRIGVLEPGGDRAVICRSFSEHSLRSLGKLRGAVLRRAGEQAENWVSMEHPEKRFHTPWLVCGLREISGILVSENRAGCLLAVPFERERPFPLIQLFCFARIAELETGRYAVFCLDREEQPVQGPRT